MIAYIVQIGWFAACFDRFFGGKRSADLLRPSKSRFLTSCDDFCNRRCKLLLKMIGVSVQFFLQDLKKLCRVRLLAESPEKIMLYPKTTYPIVADQFSGSLAEGAGMVFLPLPKG